MWEKIPGWQNFYTFALQGISNIVVLWHVCVSVCLFIGLFDIFCYPYVTNNLDKK